MSKLRRLIDVVFFGRHRLESIEKLPLGSSLGQAIALYGDPIESRPADDSPAVTQHTFAAGDYHEVVAIEWKDVIQSIVYWSLKADPRRDLACMLTSYSDSIEWQVMEKGYWYQRKDGKIRLWCSAIPAVGVGFVDFLRVESELKTAYRLTKLDDLDDVTWVPNDVVCELQRMYVECDSDALMEFSQRSESIAVSPDGRTVLIVRHHHAFDVGSGFQELNKPADLGTGYPSPVMNLFNWSPDGSSWCKIVLPRDAKVDELRFVGDRCRLAIRQRAGDLKLTFDVPSLVLRSFSGLTFSSEPHTDDGLWRILEEAQAELGGAENETPDLN